MSRPREPFGIRVYRRLLLLYPRDFRREWGDEMAQMAATLLARSRGKLGIGIIAALRLWPRLLADLASGALAERRHAARYQSATTSQPLSRRTTSMLDGLANDFRGALRTLRRYPGHALAVILTLALGIGLDTAVFSVVRTVLLEPLPYRHPERLALLAETNPDRGWTQAQVAPANFFDWRERTRSFAGIAGFGDWLTQLTATGGAAPERLRAMGVAGDLFGVLGVQPELGRGFRESETWGDAARVVVLSHRYWQHHFAGDRGVIGRQLRLNGRPYTVVGVMPAGFSIWSEDVDLWTPFGFDRAARGATWFRRAHLFRAVGRLAPGVSLATANSELGALARELERTYPDTNQQMGVIASPLADYLVGGSRRPLALLFAAAGLVLLIATANVAHLQLARVTALGRDNAVRGCLGASRWRLLRRSLLDSLAQSTVGAVLGGALAWWATPVLVRLGSAYLPRPSAAHLDLVALAFAAALAVLTALLSGVSAAWQGARPDLEAAMRSGGRGGETRGRARIRQRLVAAEVALAVIVVVAALLLVRTLVALDRVDPGFEARGVTTAGIATPSTSYADEAALASFQQRLLARVRALPGVASAGLVRKLPLTEGSWSSDFAVEGRGREEFGVGVLHREATPGYFETMRVPRVAGRPFRDGDDASSPAVALVNQALVSRYFPHESPIGRRLCFDRYPDAQSHWRTVVGVVGAERQSALAEQPQPEIFAPLAQDEVRGGFVLVVRSSLPSTAVLSMLRNTLAAIDPQLPLFDERPMTAVVAASVARQRFLLVLFALFAALALVLAAIGVYGVTADATVRRRREMAVRLAVGARTPEVVRAAMAREMSAVAVGLAAGLLGALGLGHAMAALLYGVTATDALTLAATPALLLGVALVAALLPAWRSARIAPAKVLRE